MVVQTPMDYLSKELDHAMIYVACKIKATFSCEVIRVQGTGFQSGVLSCIMPRLATHLVHVSLSITALAATIHSHIDYDEYYSQ